MKFGRLACVSKSFLHRLRKRLVSGRARRNFIVQLTAVCLLVLDRAESSGLLCALQLRDLALSSLERLAYSSRHAEGFIVIACGSWQAVRWWPRISTGISFNGNEKRKMDIPRNTEWSI